MTEPPKSRVVLPGDELAVVEEYEPGEGTYERDGRVFAAQAGRPDFDPTHRVARVLPFNPTGQLSNGDVVYGTIDEIRGSISEARILAIHGRDREVAGELSATLHVSRISSAYIEDIRDAFRLGDIVRARVIQTAPSIQVTTAEENLGVVLALCANCRGRMDKEDGRVHCPRCDRTDRRKLAADYGDLELEAPIPIVAEPEADRREGRGPRERRGDRDWGDRRGGGRGRGGRGGGRGGRGRGGGGGGGGRRGGGPRRPRGDRRR